MSEVKELIGIAVGKASMCWSEIPSGVFDSTRAKEIADDLESKLVLKSDLDALQAKYSQAMTDWSADAIKKTQRIVELEAEVTRLREKYDFQQLIKRDEEQKAEIARLREALDSILAPFDCMNCEMSGAYERKICSEHIEDNQRVAEEALNFKPKTATSADLKPKTDIEGGG